MIKNRLSRIGQKERKKWETVYDPSRGGYYPVDPSKDTPSLNQEKRNQ